VELVQFSMMGGTSTTTVQRLTFLGFDNDQHNVSCILDGSYQYEQNHMT
jgi:hypothetical protein